MLKSICFITVVILYACSAYAQNQETKEDKNQSGDSVKTYSPRAAMYRSILIPGWGQWYNDKKWKTGVFVTLDAVWIYYARLNYRKYKDRKAKGNERKDFFHDERNKFIWWLGITHIANILDAFVDAHLSDFDEKMKLTWKSPREVSIQIHF